MNNGESFSLNRVIRGVVLGLPPTFFVSLHFAMGPQSVLPLRPTAGENALGRAIPVLSPVVSLPRAMTPP
jgi:hypothetical protein